MPGKIIGDMHIKIIITPPKDNHRDLEESLKSGNNQTHTTQEIFEKIFSKKKVALL